MSWADEKQTRFKLLTRAVSSWLAYKHLTGLAGLLNEASLSVPISEFLTHNATGYEILGQEKHSNFPDQDRRLDFVAKRKRWVFVIETKSLPFGRQEFIDDLSRLALLVDRI